MLYDPTLVALREWRMIGAANAQRVVVPAITEKVGKLAVTLRHERRRFDIVYETEPVRVENTAYHRNEIAQGNLIAADAETAAVCGIVETFEEPLDHIEKLRDLAISQFQIENPDAPETTEPNSAVTSPES